MAPHDALDIRTMLSLVHPKIDKGSPFIITLALPLNVCAIS
jgi:hypothetical protein